MGIREDGWFWVAMGVTLIIFASMIAFLIIK